MKFSEVVDSLMAGKRVRKTNWESKTTFFLYDKEDNSRTQFYTELNLTPKDLMSDSWEVVE